MHPVNKMRSRNALRGLPKTVHGGQAWKLDGVEDYSHNLNPFGPPADLDEIILSAVSEIGHYPDDSCIKLKETIARTFSVDTENITIGAGSSDIIRNFPNTFINPGDKVLLSRPSFAEYGQQCRIVGADIWWNDLTEDEDFRLDVDKISEFIDMGIKALYICNPNNPTGRVEPRDKILKIVKECEEHDTLVFLDETLLELVADYDKISCAKYVKQYKNLIVAGSLTKSFAIPGIRIGFGFGDKDLIAEMEKVRMTWNVGQIEQTVARVLIGERMDYVHTAARIMFDESKVMNKELKALDFPVGELSDSFFYFDPLRLLGIKSAEFQKLMLRDNVMVRDCASFGYPFEWYVRFSVKDRERNDLFIKAVENSMKALR